MANTKRKFQETYEDLGGLQSNPSLVQTFLLSNSADIRAAIAYLKEDLESLGAKDKATRLDLIKRHEDVMVQRLEITEDIFRKYAEQKPSDKNVGISDEHNIMKNVEKKKKKGKVFDINTRQEVDNTSEEITPKEEVKTQVELNAEEERKLETARLEKAKLPHFEQLYETREERIRVTNDWLMPRLEKEFQDNEHPTDKARNFAKFHFRNHSKNIHFCTDTDIERLIQWVWSGVYKARNPLDIINNVKVSITDVIKEAENAVFELSLNEKDLKEYMKPFVMNQPLKEFESEEHYVKTDDDYETFFRGTLAFTVSEDNRKKYQQKRIQQGKTREELRDEAYEHVKDEGDKAVGKMASKLHQILTALGTDSTPIDRIGEVITYLKAKAPNLVDLYNARIAKKQKARDKKEALDTSSKKEQTQMTPEEVEEAKIKGEEDKASEEGELDKDTKKDEKPKSTEQPRFEEKLSFLTKLDDVAEVILTALNKDHEILGEDKLMKVCKEKFLVDDKMQGTEDWTEEDVSKWIEQFIEPYHSEEYSVLGAKDTDEFKECLKVYLQKYPAGQEKKRMKVFKEVLESKIPRSSFTRAIAKKVRKGHMVVVNNYFAELNQEALSAEKEQLEKQD